MTQIIAILLVNLALTLIIVTNPNTTQGRINALFLLNLLLLLLLIFGWNSVVQSMDYLNTHKLRDRVFQEAKKLGSEVKEIGRENRRRSNY